MKLKPQYYNSIDLPLVELTETVAIVLNKVIRPSLNQKSIMIVVALDEASVVSRQKYPAVF